jgi:hypothetical protein
MADQNIGNIGRSIEFILLQKDLGDIRGRSSGQ